MYGISIYLDLVDFYGKCLVIFQKIHISPRSVEVPSWMICNSTRPSLASSATLAPSAKGTAPRPGIKCCLVLWGPVVWGSHRYDATDLDLVMWALEGSIGSSCNLAGLSMVVPLGKKIFPRWTHLFLTTASSNQPSKVCNTQTPKSPSNLPPSQCPVLNSNDSGEEYLPLDSKTHWKKWSGF